MLTEREEKEIADAIHEQVLLISEEQEEHVLRQQPCKGRAEMPHIWDFFGGAYGGSVFSACVECGVSETPRDYQAAKDYIQHGR